MAATWYGEPTGPTYPGSAIVAALPRGVDAAGLDEDSTLARGLLRRCFAIVRAGSVVPWIVFQVLAKSAKPILVKTIATKPRHKTSWCLQLLELREGTELQAGQMPDELSVLPIADAGYVDVLDCINMDAAWRSRRMHGVSRTQTRRARRT